MPSRLEEQAINFIISMVDRGFTSTKDKINEGLEEMKEAAKEAVENNEKGGVTDTVLVGDEDLKNKGYTTAFNERMRDLVTWRSTSILALSGIGAAVGSTGSIVGLAVKQWSEFISEMEFFRREMGQDVESMKTFNTAIISSTANYSAALSTTGQIARQTAVGTSLSKREIAGMSAELARLQLVTEVPVETLGEYANRMTVLFGKSRSEVTELAFLMTKTAAEGKLPAREMFENFNSVAGTLETWEDRIDTLIPQFAQFTAAVNLNRGETQTAVSIFNQFADAHGVLGLQLRAADGDLFKVFRKIAENAEAAGDNATQLKGMADMWGLNVEQIKAIRDAMGDIEPIQKAWAENTERYSEQGMKALDGQLGLIQKLRIVWEDYKTAFAGGVEEIIQMAELDKAAHGILDTIQHSIDLMMGRKKTEPGMILPTKPRGPTPIGEAQIDYGRDKGSLFPGQIKIDPQTQSDLRLLQKAGVQFDPLRRSAPEIPMDSPKVQALTAKQLERLIQIVEEMKERQKRKDIESQSSPMPNSTDERIKILRDRVGVDY